jgi:ribonuclease-3
MRTKSDANDIAPLEAVLGHRFRDPATLEQALTHASYARELESQNAADGIALQAMDNEQMEFLGDAVLSFVVSQELFRRFPEYQEGELSKLRAHVVSARHLLRPARALKIGQYLRLGRGEERSGGRSKSALLVNALEAIIAALYLDGGLEQAQRFILQAILEPELEEMSRHGATKLPVTDYKSALQEAVHASGRSQPRYVLVKEEGPDHLKVFTMEAHIPPSPGGNNGFVRRGEGSTKKLAEQGAAREAWEYLQSLQGNSAVQEPGSASESFEQP